ncbi:hypothetical protein BRD13_02720 [Halobacteriales archaeon SW_5_70_135]|nr:MAG: hypothetical protein BRD13_02720 [Halobacteriales archaeon SW_5_70_135]
MPRGVRPAIATTRAELFAALSRSRRALVALAVDGLPLVLAHTVVPYWSTRYGSYLVAFSVRTAWFVPVIAGLLDGPLDAEATESG